MCDRTTQSERGTPMSFQLTLLRVRTRNMSLLIHLIKNNTNVLETTESTLSVQISAEKTYRLPWAAVVRPSQQKTM